MKFIHYKKLTYSIAKWICEMLLVSTKENGKAVENLVSTYYKYTKYRLK